MARDERQQERPEATRAHKPPAEPRADGRGGSATQSDSPLSLSRLRAAFAQMLSAEPEIETGTAPPIAAVASPDKRKAAEPATDTCEISPRSVFEAMLFVGQPDDRVLTAREVAAAMRGVSPAEIETAVAELNRDYARDGAPYEIVGSSHGYRLALRNDFQRMRDKFHRRLKEARLSAAAVEVLSIVAYNQPTTIDAINALRGAASGALLASLVRRKLVRVERSTERSEATQYRTTDRFLQHFRLEELSALPRSEELEKA